MSAKSGRVLQRVEIATHCVPELDRCIAPYINLLDFSVAKRGKIDAELCAVWDTPAMLAKPFALLQPASKAPVFLRFIETGEEGGYWPPVTQGWTATEMLAMDPDALVEKFSGSPFRRIGGPGDLYPGPKSARALQTAGPAGELMYFTRLLPGGSRFGLKGAKSFVDRPFIMVMGGTSLEAIHAFYATKLGQRVDEPTTFRIGQMSQVLGVDPNTAYRVILARLPGRSFLLELEELPAGTPRRLRPEGRLPQGLAMVSFSAEIPPSMEAEFRSPRRRIEAFPYNGRRTGVIEGPAGEWLELIDTQVLD
ncbi:MAG: hypothetical protein ACR2P6_07965 [Gammaproteobacteria bacterium]